MDRAPFIAFADRLRRGTRDRQLVEFLDHAISLAQKAPEKDTSFDRNAYHRGYMKLYMRKRRAADKAKGK